MKPLGANTRGVMSSPLRSYAFRPTPGKGRQEHRHIEGNFLVLSFERFVVRAAGFDFLDVRARDPVDAALGEERLGENIAWRHVAGAAESDAVHAEISELVFVGEVNDFGFVPHAVRAKFEFEIDHVFEGRSLARAHSVSRAHDEAFLFASFHSLDQSVAGRDAVSRAWSACKPKGCSCPAPALRLLQN